jgi:hypothetical protein
MSSHDDADFVTPELQELSDKIQSYFDFGIKFFDHTTSYVTYAALMFSTISLLLPFAGHYTDEIKKYFQYCKNLLNSGKSELSGFEDNVSHYVDEAETEMGAIKKDVKDGIRTTEQDINLVQKNVSAVSGSYGSTGK